MALSLRICGGPRLPLYRATTHPGLEAGLGHRSDRLAHLLRATMTVREGTGNHVTSQCPPVAYGEEILERSEHGVLDTIAPGREKRLGEQRLHPLDDDAPAHLGRRRFADRVRIRSEERRVGKECRSAW